MQLLNVAGQRQVKVHKNRLPQLHGQKEPILIPFARADIYSLFGKELLEGKQEVYHKADDASVGRLTTLCNETEVQQDEIEKWLVKAGASSISEMRQEQVDACIQLLTNRAIALDK